jgi:single-strand DNA-binding protein
MLNKVILIGRLTRDPELRFTAGGNPVANFTLAVDRNYKNSQGEKETDFINVIAWRQLGERCSTYLSKGKLAAVDGRLQIRNYETQDGQKRTVAEVVADDVRFLSPKSGGSSYTADSYLGAPPPAEKPVDEGPDFPLDDDLPF